MMTMTAQEGMFLSLHSNMVFEIIRYYNRHNTVGRREGNDLYCKTIKISQLYCVEYKPINEQAIVLY